MPILRPRDDSTITANVIRPMPPSWMSSITTPCPNNVYALPVSTTTRPVTVTAEVDVKRASERDMPCVDEMGSINKAAPMAIQLR